VLAQPVRPFTDDLNVGERSRLRSRSATQTRCSAPCSADSWSTASSSSG